MQERIDRSTACCASRSPASGSCGRSCASRRRRSASRGQRRRSPTSSLRAGRLMSLDVPDRRLIVNVSSVAVLWVGADRDRQRASSQVGSLIAYLSLPHPDPDVGHDGDVHGVDDPAGRGRRRAHRRGARHRVVACVPPDDPVTERHRARHARVPRRRLPLPGRRAPGARRHLVPRRGRADHGDHRQHRRRQDDARQPRPAAVRRHRRARCSSTASTSASSTPSCCGARIGYVPQKAVPVLGHGRDATCASAGPTPPTTSCGRRSRSPRPPTSCRRCPAASRARSTQGGTTCRAGSASGWRSPGRSSPARDLPVRRLVLGARPRDRRAAARRARARTSPTPRSVVAQRVSTIRDADQILVLEDGAVGRARHPRRTARDLPDLRRDRRLAASARERAHERSRPTTSSDARRSTTKSLTTGRPGPTRRVRARWRAAGMPVERSRRTSARPCAASAASWARDGRRSSWCCVLDGRQRHARRARPAVCSARRPTSSSSGVTSGDGIDFGALHRKLLLVAGLYVGVVGAGATRRRTSSPASCSARCTRCASRSRTSSTGCRSSYVDRQPRGDLLSRVTNDIDNLAQSLQQTLSQILTSLLTLIGVADHDVHDLAAAGPRRARRRSRCRCG